MRDITSNNFGLLIAYVLPGFTVLWELRLISPTVEAWLSATESNAPTVAGFLYATLGSVAIGMTVNTIRWLIVDAIHHRTGISIPKWDFSNLASRVSAFETLIEIHYHHYQFASGMFIAVPIATAIRWFDTGPSVKQAVLILGLEILFFLGSRDTLKKYYQRGARVLETNESVIPA